MNRKRDLYLIAEAYESVTKKQDVGEEWTNMGDWVKFLSQPNIANKPVSYRVALADQPEGSMSYGGNVTFNQIINNAKMLLAGNPSGKQKTLTNTANQLQDYFAGLNSAKVIDDTTRDDLMDMVANLSNTEKFIDSFGQIPQSPQPQVAKTLPGQGPAVTQRQKEAEEFRAVGDEDMGPQNAVGSMEFLQLSTREKAKILGEVSTKVNDLIEKGDDENLAFLKVIANDPTYIQIFKKELVDTAAPILDGIKANINNPKLMGRIPKEAIPYVTQINSLNFKPLGVDPNHDRLMLNLIIKFGEQFLIKEKL